MKAMLRRAGIAAAFLVGLPLIAYAVSEYQTAGGQTVGSVVLMWINGSNQAQPTSAANPLPVTTTLSFTGNGSRATSTTSGAINTMTVNSGGAALPSTLNYFVARTTPLSATDAAICMKGGTCTCPENGVASTNGVTLYAGGGGYTFNAGGVASSTPTIVACSGTPTVEFQW